MRSPSVQVDFFLLQSGFAPPFFYARPSPADCLASFRVESITSPSWLLDRLRRQSETHCPVGLLPRRVVSRPIHRFCSRSRPGFKRVLPLRFCLLARHVCCTLRPVPLLDDRLFSPSSAGRCRPLSLKTSRLPLRMLSAVVFPPHLSPHFLLADSPPPITISEHLHIFIFLCLVTPTTFRFVFPQRSNPPLKFYPFFASACFDHSRPDPFILLTSEKGIATPALATPPTICP